MNGRAAKFREMAEARAALIDAVQAEVTNSKKPHPLRTPLLTFLELAEGYRALGGQLKHYGD